MCGRYLLTTPVDALAQLFRFSERPNLGPRYNIAPTQDVPIVRLSREGDRRELIPELIMVRWGLVPYWADDPKIGNRLINARAETIERTPAFREAYRRRRCLVPADGFLRVAQRGQAAAAAADPAPGPGAVRLRGPLGALEAAGRRRAALLHDRDLPAERAGRARARPDAGDPRSGRPCRLAGPRGGRPGAAPALPAGLARGHPGQPEGQQPGQRRSGVHSTGRGRARAAAPDLSAPAPEARPRGSAFSCILSTDALSSNCRMTTSRSGTPLPDLGD